jgi:amino acid transporter
VVEHEYEQKGRRLIGQVEFALSAVKVVACVGFMILGIIIDCGGVPSDPRGYIGGRYWFVFRGLCIA